VALLAREILSVAGVYDVIFILVAIGIATGGLGQTVVGQVALGLAAHHSRVQAPLVDVLHLLAAVPVQLGLQRAAPAPLAVVLGPLVRGVQSLEHWPRLVAVLEEGLFAGVVGGTGPDVLLGAVHDLRAVRSAGAIGLLAAHSRFIRVFG